MIILRVSENLDLDSEKYTVASSCKNIFTDRRVFQHVEDINTASMVELNWESFEGVIFRDVVLNCVLEIFLAIGD